MKTLGEVRDLLAGLRDPQLDRVGALSDRHLVEVSSSVGKGGRGVLYAVVVEIPGAKLASKPRKPRALRG